VTPIGVTLNSIMYGPRSFDVLKPSVESYLDMLAVCPVYWRHSVAVVFHMGVFELLRTFICNFNTENLCYFTG
jgi:hypothetical protein